MERLICYAYWPWGTRGGPVARNKCSFKKAVLVTSTAMPGFLIPIFTGAMGALKKSATIMGAKPVGVMYVGFAAVNKDQKLTNKVSKKASRLGLRI